MDGGLPKGRADQGGDEQISVTGGPIATRAGRAGWAMFDWANQPYFTLITTFIFAPYFTATVVGDPVQGQALWGYGQSVAGLIIAIMSPILGAVADRGGPRKPWIMAFQAVCVIAMFGLWWALPGASSTALLLILAAVVVASVGAEFSIVFNNAMLPSLVSRKRLGRLSGIAWATGYAGGLIALFFVLLAFGLPDQPLFGLDKASHEHDRIVGPLSAVWMVLFVLPMLIFTPDVKPRKLPRGQAVRLGLGDLWATLKQVSRHKNIMTFLLARMVFQDGLSAIFAFGGIYAAGIFAWQTTDLGIFGIILTVAAGLGALAGGWLDDRIGSKRTIIFSVIGLIIATLGVVSIGTSPAADGGRVETVLFVISFNVSADGGLLSTPAQWVFLFFGIIIGACGGPAQAASRTMVARLAPPDEIGKFYGLFALSGKATAFVAPFAVAVMTQSFDSQRAGIAIILVFLVVGLIGMFAVREPASD